MPTTTENTNKRQRIEVLRNENDDVSVWFPAFLLPSADHNQKKTNPNMIQVEFENLTTNSNSGEETSTSSNAAAALTEYVYPADVRPAPERELHRLFKVGDLVEAFYGEKKGWRKGRILNILENSKYQVLLLCHRGSEIVEVDQWDLRVFRVWENGTWGVPPTQLQKDSPKADVTLSGLQKVSSETEADVTSRDLQKDSFETEADVTSRGLQKDSSETEADVTSRGLEIRIKYSRRTPRPKFEKGMVVEVKGRVEHFQDSWYPATIVELLGNNSFLLEYQTLKTEDGTEFLKEAADAASIRPLPPEIQRVEPFEPFAQVDAWYKEGWKMGHISHVMDGLMYMVYFSKTKKETVFKHSNLRPHQEWVEGRWVAAPKKVLSEAEENVEELRLQTRYSGNKSEQFTRGMRVEVKSDEEGYEGAWYTAVILGPLSNNNFLVEYQTLKTDDESALLTEIARASYIRPSPPLTQRIDRFKMLEEVDAWYNDGWWVGVISKVLTGLKYAVYFSPNNEEMEFSHRDLRPHQEWIGGKWITAFKEKSKSLMKSKIGKCKGRNGRAASAACFSPGAKVEVKSDEVGYEGSWYPALIARHLSDDKYLIQYQTLKTDDGVELLNEAVDASYIRPYPTVIQQQPEKFRLFDEVEAWHNEGWWIGEICKVLDSRKYRVYFKNSSEVLEFHHSDLRPHQDWINGQWIQSNSGRR